MTIGHDPSHYDAMAREAFYDNEIAPVLAALGQKCEAHGLSFLAVAEWKAGETGHTGTVAASAGYGVRLVHAEMQARGNVDVLIFAIMRAARESGHSSVCLSMLGVPPCAGETEVRQ
ncbi:hypothetical protein MKI84_08415 [Ancylobacter sp. A5.8]|uniref:hypothetical protein n=1 Tax=Ancylobacter gelatini TaxID=2919920 RepID=UPI001F4D8F15|nr:hypothetical protein [Ancylobacter gelatini]MCJ8142938.1 hypothetical protein [Ancylobacter gelatini]